jgi:hypothetical protein
MLKIASASIARRGVPRRRAPEVNFLPKPGRRSADKRSGRFQRSSFVG